MPGIATRLEILRLTVDVLKAQPAGSDLRAIADVLEANPVHARLGAIGPALADFLPAGPPAPGEDYPPDYSGVWQTLFQFLGGDLGLYATLTRMRQILDQIDQIVRDEDEDALIALKESGESDRIKETTGTFRDLVGTIKDVADDLIERIRELKPNVCTPGPKDPVPPPDQWRVRDLLHWRRTGAFAHALLRRARQGGKPEQLAYAYGWWIGYAASAGGAPFVNSSAGGPPRTQWWRQRFVKNYVDAWSYGFYRTGAAMSGDVPTPPYAAWRGLCGAKLHEQLALGAPDPADLMRRIKTRQPFPAGHLPADFGQFWVGAFAEVYGTPAPGRGVDPANLNGAYLMTWLVLWFMTGGDVIPCDLSVPAEPPGGCGAAPQELNPFKTDPETGNPIEPPIPDPESDVSTNDAGVVCGWILAIVGGLVSVFASAAAGAAIIAGGIALIEDKIDVDWKDLRCQMYWLRMYIYLGLKGLHQVLAISGFGYPDSAELGDDSESLELLGIPYTWQSGKFLVRSRPSDGDFPSKPWDGGKLTFNQPPTAFETPRTVAYRTAAYPSFFIDDDANNPLPKGDVKTRGSAFPFRPDPAVAGGGAPIQFGNAVANAIDLLANLDRVPPGWNLDADRGLAYLGWEFDGAYDPDNVHIKPEP